MGVVVDDNVGSSNANDIHVTKKIIIIIMDAGVFLRVLSTAVSLLLLLVVVAAVSALYIAVFAPAVAAEVVFATVTMM